MKNLPVHLVILFMACCSTAVKFQKRTEIVLEQIYIVYSDPQYVIEAQGSIGRSSRATNYVLNFTMNVLRPWYNNVTLSLKSFEFKDNRFKESFIRISDKICDLLQKPLIWFPLPAVRKHGNIPIKCPLSGTVYIRMFELDFEYFPENFPKSRWLFNFTATMSTSKKVIFIASHTMRIQYAQVRKNASKISNDTIKNIQA